MEDDPLRSIAPKVLIVSPRFELPSFWNYFSTCHALGKKAPAPPLGLLTVAALLPSDWEFRLIDRNFEQLRRRDIAWADLVITGGMIPQRKDVSRIIDLAHSHGKLVCVGGPDVTSSPSAFAKADFRVLGEAEDIIADFVSAWQNGARSGEFTAEKFTIDVTKTPLPRYDLLKINKYLSITVQFSRGCPFNCEFCDIIELYGRNPRVKTNDQVCAELDYIYELGYRGSVLFVDDNLIGNKKALKQLLPRIVEWQQDRNYPFALSTQASINLADDQELLSLMKNAGFDMVFIGIESPNVDVLISTQKKQNTRRDLASSVQTIYSAGMGVMAGFIIGFDQEPEDTSNEIINYINAAQIPVCMVGTLAALPGTQLERRLIAEGRLLPGQASAAGDNAVGDQCTDGLQFETLRPKAEILRDYKKILDTIYDTKTFFTRCQAMANALKPLDSGAKRTLRESLGDLSSLARLFLYVSIRHPRLLTRFLRGFRYCARHKASALPPIMFTMSLYLHVGRFARFVSEQIEKEIAEIGSDDERGELRKAA